MVKTLCKAGHKVYGIDNLNDYYPVTLKYSRLAETGIQEKDITQGREKQSSIFPNYTFKRLDITDRLSLERLFASEKFDVVVNLAAQAGVRYSIINPYAYIESNVVGFLNILENCRTYNVGHLIYASSSSVYGGNTKDRVDNQVSIYAATKKTDELFANVYAKLYGLHCTGLRFFTVYGPWGRPDMAPMLFADAILDGKSIKVFNNGDLSRDFTYIDDIIEGIVRVIDAKPQGEIPADVLNIGHGHPMLLMDFIRTLENCLGIEAKKEMYPMQQGDVYTTYADTTKLENRTGYIPLSLIHI